MESDIKEKVDQWRIKAEQGTLTLLEMREAIEFLRQNRSKSTQTAKAKGKSKKIINSNDLLKELEDL